MAGRRLQQFFQQFGILPVGDYILVDSNDGSGDIVLLEVVGDGGNETEQAASEADGAGG